MTVFSNINLRWFLCRFPILVDLEFGVVNFEEGGTRENSEKTLGAMRDPTTNSIHTWHRARIEPELHWRKANALTTAPSLLPK